MFGRCVPCRVFPLGFRVRMPKRKADEIFALVAEIDEVLDTVRNSLDREREEHDRLERVVCRWSHLAWRLRWREYQRNSPSISEILVAAELAALLD